MDNTTRNGVPRNTGGRNGNTAQIAGGYVMKISLTRSEIEELVIGYGSKCINDEDYADLSEFATYLIHELGNMAYHSELCRQGKGKDINQEA